MTHASKTAALVWLLAFFSTHAPAEVTIADGKFWFNGVRQETVWGRSCFKLSNQVTYHFAGTGGGKWGLGSARDWVDHQLETFGPGSVCRVFLETDGWSRCEQGSQADDGIPQNCMFGSEPVDQGFWNVEALRTGGRPTEMHGIGRQTLRWFFETSQEIGLAFELVIVATLKHNDVPVPQQTHVIRQTMAEAYRLQAEFPQALIIMSAINEWNAHSRWTLGEVNLLAVRVDRWKHPETGDTRVQFESPGPDWEAEQCPGCVFIVDGGGGNTFDFDVGPEPGKFRLGAVHPVRDSNWFRFPNAQQKAQLVQDSRGMPWGFPESMYYVEAEDETRARGWYRTDGWTTSWAEYEQFLDHVESQDIAYFIVHDEKGAQSDPEWPRAETRVDAWARAKFGGSSPPPPPPPPPPTPRVSYDHLIEFAYQLALKRPADPAGMSAYNEWLGVCYSTPARDCFSPLMDVLVRSQEYKEKFSR